LGVRGNTRGSNGTGDEEMIAVTCLAALIFFEARGESLDGQLAVGQVAMNRMESPRWPNDMCAVANQSKQFSYTHDGLSDNPERHINNSRDAKALVIAREIAEEFLIKGVRFGLTSTHYHTVDVSPYWSRTYALDGRIGRHLFYTAPANQ
tara:strand:+ start:1676 stop:2125 length:450 start_codon:yes stop_codon:yes gene_type:complete